MGVAAAVVAACGAGFGVAGGTLGVLERHGGLPGAGDEGDAAAGGAGPPGPGSLGLELPVLLFAEPEKTKELDTLLSFEDQADDRELAVGDRNAA